MEQSRLDGLKRAFRPIPDCEFYYPATSHEQVLARVLGALGNEDGMALVLGEPGLGKTLLGHCLLGRLGSNVHCAFLLNSHFRDPVALLQALLYEFELPYQNRNEQELRLTFTHQILQNYEAGGKTVVLVDEAQNLGNSALEELRLLANLEGAKGKAFQVILLALPALLETLEAPTHTALRQRLNVQAELQPLDIHEASDYLAQRMRHCGLRLEDTIADEAMALIARASGGIPRILHRILLTAAEMSATNGIEQIDAEVALEAVSELGLSEPEEIEEETPKSLASSPSASVDAARGHRLFASKRRPA